MLATLTLHSAHSVNVKKATSRSLSSKSASILKWRTPTRWLKQITMLYESTSSTYSPDSKRARLKSLILPHTSTSTRLLLQEAPVPQRMDYPNQHMARTKVLQLSPHPTQDLQAAPPPSMLSHRPFRVSVDRTYRTRPRQQTPRRRRMLVLRQRLLDSCRILRRSRRPTCRACMVDRTRTRAGSCGVVAGFLNGTLEPISLEPFSTAMVLRSITMPSEAHDREYCLLRPNWIE